MATAVGGAAEITSDEGKEIPGSVNSPAEAIEWASYLLFDDFKGSGEGLDDSVLIQELLATLEGEKKSACDAAPGGGDEDDDCVMLDGDPFKAAAVANEKKLGKDGSEEELQIVAEKGEVACRDFPHPRHLCARFPLKTGSHASYCTMCHCYVCDSPAPCPRWGKGTLSTDHCHATDKDEKWKKLRQSLKRKSLPPSQRGSIKKVVRSTLTAPSSEQYTGHQTSGPPLGTTVNQPSVQRVIPVTSNVSKNQQMRPSIRAAQNLGQVVNQPKGPVNQPIVGRVPVASNASQNQQMHSAIRGAQNVGQFVRMPKASAPGHQISGKRLKTSGAAPTVLMPSNGYNLNRPLPNDATLPPASSHVFRTAPVVPGSNITQYRPSQRFLGAPVLISQGLHVRPSSHLQVDPNRVAGTGLQTFQSSAPTTQGAKCVQNSQAIQNAWQVTHDNLAPQSHDNLASQLGVSDYNINDAHGRESAITQYLHPSQLIAPVKASQGVEQHRSSVPATAQMRPADGLLPNRQSGDNAVMQKNASVAHTEFPVKLPSETS